MSPLTPGAKQEHDLATEFRNFRMQYGADQQRNREILHRIDEAIFGDGTLENVGMRAEVRRNTAFRIKLQVQTRFMRKVWVSLLAVSGTLAAWWGALRHKGP